MKLSWAAHHINMERMSCITLCYEYDDGWDSDSFSNTENLSWRDWLLETTGSCKQNDD
jgi:hypothetical protein